MSQKQSDQPRRGSLLSQLPGFFNDQNSIQGGAKNRLSSPVPPDLNGPPQGGSSSFAVSHHLLKSLQSSFPETNWNQVTSFLVEQHTVPELGKKNMSDPASQKGHHKMDKQESAWFFQNPPPTSTQFANLASHSPPSGLGHF